MRKSSRSYTEEQFRAAVKKANSIHETLLLLSLCAEGGAYRTFYRAAKEWSVDFSHFGGRGWSKGMTLGPTRPIEDYLSNRVGCQSKDLRPRLIKEGFFPHQCSMCLNTEWLGQKIPLELDHIDGNHDNNLLENLRLLCPTCHRLTPTHGARNKKTRRDARTVARASGRAKILCLDCGKEISRKGAARCKSCAGRFREPTKITWPSPGEMTELVWQMPTRGLAEKLGISDVAIAKFCRRHQIPKPPRGYWAKLAAV